METIQTEITEFIHHCKYEKNLILKLSAISDETLD